VKVASITRAACFRDELKKRKPQRSAATSDRRCFAVFSLAHALKQKGVSAEDAGKQLNVEFKMKHPDWPDMNVSAFVQHIYAETK
jgi:hypothetical protein